MLLAALAVPGLLPAQAGGRASSLHPDRRSRASKAAAAAHAAADGPVTVRAADAAAEAGLAVADALRADGVVRVDGILTREMAAALLECATPNPTRWWLTLTLTRARARTLPPTLHAGG